MRAAAMTFGGECKNGRALPLPAQIAIAAQPFLPALPGGGRVKAARLANKFLHRLGFTLTPR